MKAALNTPSATAEADQYTSAEDFGRVFTEHMDKLYRLAFLLTGDAEAAEQCFVGGLEDSLHSNTVFRKWALLWARQAIIKNAIATLSPHPHSDSALSRHDYDSEEIPVFGQESIAIAEVLALNDFDRFVFVMSVLEGLSDNQCSFLLDCSLPELQRSRNQAIQQIACAAESAMFTAFESRMNTHS